MTNPLYEIEEDPYVMKARTFVNSRGQTVTHGDYHFLYSIVRVDGSRVFRAQTMKAAEDLQRRLIINRLGLNED